MSFCRALVYPGTRLVKPSVQLKANDQGHDGQDGAADLTGPLAWVRKAATRSATRWPATGEGEQGDRRPAGEDKGEDDVGEADPGGAEPILVMAVRMGPAHGVKSTPSPSPRTKAPELPVGWWRPKRAKGRSRSSPRGGEDESQRPPGRGRPDRRRAGSRGGGRELSSRAMPARVKTLKLTIRPPIMA